MELAANVTISGWIRYRGPVRSIHTKALPFDPLPEAISLADEFN